jgi:hypothetical protein
MVAASLLEVAFVVFTTQLGENPPPTLGNLPECLVISWGTELLVMPEPNPLVINEAGNRGLTKDSRQKTVHR